MKTLFYLILTSLISTGAMFAGLNQPDGWPCFLIAFAAWGLFFWGWYRRAKKAAERKSKEQLFKNFMRSKFFKHK